MTKRRSFSHKATDVERKYSGRAISNKPETAYRGVTLANDIMKCNRRKIWRPL